MNASGSVFRAHDNASRVQTDGVKKDHSNVLKNMRMKKLAREFCASLKDAQDPRADGQYGAFRVRAMVRGKGVRRVARKVVNNMNVLLVEGIGVPLGTFVAKIPDVGTTEFVPIGSAHIGLDVVPVGKDRLRIYKSDRMFAVTVTTRKAGEIFQQWVEPAGVAGRIGISEVRVPMPKGERGHDGREYIRLSDLDAFFGSDAARCRPLLKSCRYECIARTARGPHFADVNRTYRGNDPVPEQLYLRAAEAKDACILAFVGDGTK